MDKKVFVFAARRTSKVYCYFLSSSSSFLDFSFFLLHLYPSTCIAVCRKRWDRRKRLLLCSGVRTKKCISVGLVTPRISQSEWPDGLVTRGFLSKGWGNTNHLSRAGPYFKPRQYEHFGKREAFATNHFAHWRNVHFLKGLAMYELALVSFYMEPYSPFIRIVTIEQSATLNFNSADFCLIFLRFS